VSGSTGTLATVYGSWFVVFQKQRCDVLPWLSGKALSSVITVTLP